MDILNINEEYMLPHSIPITECGPVCVQHLPTLPSFHPLKILQDKYYYAKENPDVSELAALGVGVFHILPETEGTEVVLVGLLPEADGIIDDDCNELAYKCVYQIQ